MTPHGPQHSRLTWSSFCWPLNCARHSGSLPVPPDTLLFGFLDTTLGLFFPPFPPPPPPPSRIHSLPALSPWPVPPWLPCPLTSGWVGQGERGTSRLGSGRRGGQAFVTPAPSLSSCSSGGGCIPEVTAPTHTGLQHHSPSLTHQAQGC